MRITFRKPAERRALSTISPLTVIKTVSSGRTDRLLVTNDVTRGTVGSNGSIEVDTVACVDLKSGVIHQVDCNLLVEILESELSIQDSDEASFENKW